MINVSQHEYTVVDFDRAIIGRWLGISSLIISSLASKLIINLNSIYGVPAFVISSSVIYLVTYFLFIHFFWKILPLFIRFPNINGTWDIEGQNSDSDNGDGWNGKLTIVQDFNKLCVTLETDKSLSYSQNATLNVLPDKRVSIYYSYQNKPDIPSNDFLIHEGVCDIRFDKGLKAGKANYFNLHGRQTKGNFSLTKQSK